MLNASGRRVALLLVAVAGIAVAVRIPSALRDFSRQASYGAGQTAYGGALAAADAIPIDDDFVVAALQAVPRSGRYALLRSSSLQIATRDYHLTENTYNALPDYMREVLLPRVPVTDVAKGDWILCYACDTAPYEGRTHWVFSDPSGRKIGLVER